ncbi:GNAT family N-acetyltransferase [Modestobacter sp. I12A-02628]|uniref:GNAT family N-acetyltransferase n=2 Tax=Goekera deserti TaxID=2497753 RepID=A0A7K3WH57_9ACTN|nr:GNAT family N-acetyltransferase [Goekera deserti]NDI50250.1 GNAT family N-acetyltransferase [Goekera deserti]NEL55818.1 GNAT family N-acetyltransferase [Goekera deserti]
MLAGRIETHGVAAGSLGAPLWGFGPRDRLDAICLAGANLIPFARRGHEAAAAAAFADRARRSGRRCSTIVGPAPSVAPLWQLLAPHWGPPRDLRARQPLLAIDGPPAVTAEPRVRPVHPSEIEVLMPAAIAMFTEEVGVSPLRVDGGAGYRARVAELVRAGQSLAWIEDGEVVFKAEIGAVSRAACQVQGVWVAPRHRGRGIGQSGTAAVVEYARQCIAPVVSLYVNDFNAAARAAYARVGFRHVGTYSSVLF